MHPMQILMSRHVVLKLGLDALVGLAFLLMHTHLSRPQRDPDSQVVIRNTAT